MLASVLSLFRWSLSDLPCAGRGDPQRSSFCWTSHGGISGDGWGHVEGEAHQDRFLWKFQNFAGFHLPSKTVYIQCASVFGDLLQPGRDVNDAAWLSVISLYLPVLLEVSAATLDFHTGRVFRGGAGAFVRGCM